MAKAPRDCQIDVWDLMTLFLLFEKQNHKASKYVFYLNSLPEKFTNPIAWAPDYWEFLPTQTKRLVEESNKDSELRFRKIQKINKTARLLVNLNWEDFIWTQCCITSRNLECEFVSIKGEKKPNEKMKMKYNFRNTGSLSNLTRPNSEHEKMKLEQKAFQVFNDKGHLTRQLVAPTWLKRTEHDTCGMAPVFEMFNHAEDNNAFFDFDKINKKLYVAAIKDIEEGQQVFINYSDREDDEMLMHYGFAFPPNVNKHSFLEVNKEELRDAVAIVSNTPSHVVEKISSSSGVEIKTQ